MGAEAAGVAAESQSDGIRTAAQQLIDAGFRDAGDTGTPHEPRALVQRDRPRAAGRVKRHGSLAGRKTREQQQHVRQLAAQVDRLEQQKHTWTAAGTAAQLAGEWYALKASELQQRLQSLDRERQSLAKQLEDERAMRSRTEVQVGPDIVQQLQLAMRERDALQDQARSVEMQRRQLSRQQHAIEQAQKQHQALSAALADERGRSACLQRLRALDQQEMQRLQTMLSAWQAGRATASDGSEEHVGKELELKQSQWHSEREGLQRDLDAMRDAHRLAQRQAELLEQRLESMAAEQQQLREQLASQDIQIATYQHVLMHERVAGQQAQAQMVQMQQEQAQLRLQLRSSDDGIVIDSLHQRIRSLSVRVRNSERMLEEKTRQLEQAQQSAIQSPAMGARQRRRLSALPLRTSARLDAIPLPDEGSGDGTAERRRSSSISNSRLAAAGGAGAAAAAADQSGNTAAGVGTDGAAATAVEADVLADPGPEDIEYEPDAETGKHRVRFATQHGLLLHLTRPEGPFEGPAVDTMIVTHASICTSQELLQSLRSRFHFPSGQYGAKQMAVCLKVQRVLKLWLERYPRDFVGNTEMLAELQAFLTEDMPRAGLDKASSQLSRLVKRNVHDYEQQMKQRMTQDVPKPIVPRVRVIHGVMDVSAEEMARQLSMIEFDLFKQIRTCELLRQAWSKAEKETRAPNVLAFIRRFNDTASWVASEVLMIEKPRQRGQVIERFIRIANICRSMGNFNSTMEIVAGLQLNSIHRLKKSWSHVTRHSNESLKDLIDLMSTLRSYKNYRAALRTAALPALPYLGVFLTDLTFIGDGNPNRGALVNYARLEMEADVIRENVLRFQRIPYAFEPLPQVQDYLMRYHAMDDDEQYQRSLVLEPRAQT